MRYIGRQHGMAGTDALQCAEIDQAREGTRRCHCCNATQFSVPTPVPPMSQSNQIVDGIEDIKRKYLALIYQVMCCGRWEYGIRQVGTELDRNV